MTDILNASRADELLTALAEQLAAAGERYELVAVGGSALLALGLIDRPTRDVDVVALRQAGMLTKAEPFPRALVGAHDRVARDYGLPEDWLNAGPADLIDFGLPAGFLDRVETRTFGQALTVHFASRSDPLQAVRVHRPRRRQARAGPPCAPTDAGRARPGGAMEQDPRSVRRLPTDA